MRRAHFGAAPILAALWTWDPAAGQAEEVSPGKPAAVDRVALADRLEQAIDARLDIDLKSGQSYIRCRLIQVVRSKKGGPPLTLKFEPADADKPITVGFAAIRTITLDRQKVYEAPDGPAAKGKAALVERNAKASAAEREKWMAEAKKNNVAVWPELSTAEHKTAEKEVRRQIDKIMARFPGTSLRETHEFLVVSDMPGEAVAPYANSLDQMYDMMCQLYGIKKGAAVWKGKCPIVAFLREVEFAQFEAEFFQKTDLGSAQGLCHSSSDGDVLIACYCGNSPEYFGQVLVHETSHGFIHRYRTMARLPSWANEGMAEWIAQSLVNYQGGVVRKRQLARQAIAQGHTLGGMFDERQITPLQYGMATDLTDFMIRQDRRRYADWVNGMKAGKSWEFSLKDSYGVTPVQLLSAYGEAIGVPDLKP